MEREYFPITSSYPLAYYKGYINGVVYFNHNTFRYSLAKVPKDSYLEKTRKLKATPSLPDAKKVADEINQGVAWDSLNASEEVLRSISGADAICWGSLAGRSDQSFRAINEILKAAPEDSMKVFDINIRQNYYTKDKIDSSLNIASVLKLNEDELPIISNMFSLPAEPQDALKEIALRWNLQYVIYTCGAAFSEIHSQTGLLSHIPTPKVKVADTVGAGDSFTAAFVTSILLGKSAEESHQTAVSLAAKVCSRPGAIIEL